MKSTIVQATALFGAGRLDARYSVDGIAGLRTRLATTSRNRAIASMGTATMPARLKKVAASPAENFIPYLRPYDVFEYLPPDSDRLSWAGTPSIEDYAIQAGDILQTRSGRNLGPVTLADGYLARFAVSDDMIRIRISDEVHRLYTFAFLRSALGQRVLRGDRGGSVISHISPQQVGALEVPIVDSIVSDVAGLVRRAIELRGAARAALHDAVVEVNSAYPASQPSATPGWSIGAGQLRDRFDAAFHPRSLTIDRDHLRSSGGVVLGDVANVIKPGGRHKMVYVEAGHGEPFLSGRQILQCDVVAPKYLSSHSAQADGGFSLRQDSVIFQSDGRAEEGLGYPAYVTAERDGWLASGHVGRALPHDAVDAGWIWAAMASDVVRRQVVALSCGSVVDALYPEDVAGVLLPPRDAVDSSAVRTAWGHMSEGSQLLAVASEMIDEALGTTD